MLLVDGVKYDEYVPKSEDEFEHMVSEHAQEIFGEHSLYFDRKLKLKSLSGIGSIPDGYAIIIDDKFEWHVIEIELSSHPLYNHIVPQVSKFISGINNPSTRKIIIEAMYHALISYKLDYFKMDKIIQTGEYYKFISDIVSNSPVITIIVEKDTPELHDALESLNHPKKSIVEFRTFTREGVGLPVHAHLFEPLYKYIKVFDPLWEYTKGAKRDVGWKGEGYTLVHVEGDYEIYEKNGNFEIVILPNRDGRFTGYQSLEEAKAFINRDKDGSRLTDTLEVTVQNPSNIKFHHFYIPKGRRNFFPGYKISFELETDTGIINTWVSSAPAGSQVGDPNAGVYIQANLAKWYKAHPTIKVGDKVRISVIESMKKYRLEIAE